MKKILLILLAFVHLNTAYSQISSGGEPVSKNLMLSKNISSITLEAVSEDWKINAALEDGKKGGLERVAKNIATNYSLKNSGSWEYLFNGDRVWRLKIKAQGAIGINPLFKNFYLPEGSKLFVYNPNFKQVLGAYTSENNHESKDFSTEVIFGDELVIEYIEPANKIGEGSFTIDQIGSFFKDVGVGAGIDYGFGDSDPCQINVNCSPVGNNWQDEKRGVARILVVTPSGQGWCTGSLVNNGNYDCKNYFLTALHCGDDNNINFNQWVFYFNYEFSGCTNGTSGSVPSNTSTGATFRSESNVLNTTSSSSDFLLLELNNVLPASYNVYYNGWNTTTSSPSGGVGIHHPAGDVKKISTYGSGSNSVGISWGNGGTYSVISGSTHWSLEWTSNSNGHGVTEGGSSGSPIFNNNGEIVGTLSGGGSYCTSLTADDQYGKMSYHWQSNGTANNRRLKPWLDPSNSGLTSLPGSNAPCAPVSPNDAGITIVINPTGTLCSPSVIPEVTLKNFGTANLTSVTIKYRVNTGVISTFNWTGNLAQNATTNVTLPAITAPVGNNTLEAYTENPNGASDSNTNNDSSNEAFTVNSTSNLPLLENFEANAFPPAGFTIGNGDNDETWQQDASVGFGTGTKSMFIDNWDYDANGQFDWLVTETFDFSSVVNASLTYDLAYAYYDQTTGTNVGYDTLGIAVSTNCGASFYWLWKQGGTQLATAGGLGVEFVPTNSQWTNKNLDLSSLNNETSVQFAFIAINGYGNNMYIDNINISNVVVPTPPIAEFSANDASICITNSVSFTDLSTNTPTSWSWSFPGGTPSNSSMQNPTVNYNTAGNYAVTLTATNADGSDTEVKSGFITVNNNPTVNFTTSAVSCFGGNDGSVTANVSGAGGYNYAWTGNGLNSATLNNQSAGSFIVNITDVNGCSVSGSGNISQPTTGLGLSNNITTAYCNNNNGSVIPQASGGTPPYTYTFSGGGNGTNMLPGNYSITVTDFNNCTYGENVTVPNTDESFTISVSTTNTSCTSNTGTAIASVNGVISGYTYLWSNGQTTSSAQNLAYGAHSVTLTNGNGCSETTSFNIGNINAPLVNVSTTDLDCFGDSSGSASISVSTSSSNYTVVWSSSSNSGNVENNLSGGNYMVTVTDDVNCFTQKSFTIIEPEALAISFMNQDEHCDSKDGQLVANATGGTPSYNYVWNSGVSGNVLLNQEAGNYSVTITDANNCISQASTSINNIAAASLSNIIVTEVSCADDENGSILVDLSGGTGTLTTNWSNGDTTEDLTNVSGGNYTLTVTDSENCITDTTISIFEPEPINITLNVIDNSPNSTSTITANASGGSQIYDYSWNTGSSAQTITNLPIGTYTITVSDSKNCSSDTTVNIGNVSILDEEIIQNISLYPNPIVNELNIVIELEELLEMNFNVMNSIGQKLISKKIEASKFVNEKINMKDYSKGVYYLEIETKKGTSVHKFIKMN